VPLQATHAVVQVEEEALSPVGGTRETDVTEPPAASVVQRVEVPVDCRTCPAVPDALVES